MFIRVSNLSFSYSDSVAIICDANFQITLQLHGSRRARGGAFVARLIF